jgi:hypothetical protein
MRPAFYIAGLAAILGGVSAACSPKPEPPPPYDTALATKEVMRHVIEPAAQGLWSRAGEFTTDKGVESLTPDTDEEWLAAENEATTVAEAGNLLMLPARVRHIMDPKTGKVSIKDGGDWVKFAQNLSIRARAARDAVKARDPDRMFETGGEMYQACVSCHEKYYIPFLKPDQPASPKAPQ